MLKAMRTGAQSIVMKVFLFGLLLMAMAGLAMMDVQGMFRSGVSNTAVAKIGRDRISTVEADRIVSNVLQQQNIPPALAAQIGLPHQILTQEIGSRVFARAARDAGIIPDDKAVAREIGGILKPMVEQGLSKKEALGRLLANTGMSEPALVAAVRSQMASATLASLVASGARTPKQMLEDALKFKHEQRGADVFTLSAADLGKPARPSDAELQEYYKTVSARFSLPEYRAIDVLVLDKKSLGIEVKETEESLRAYYEDHKSDYTTPETRSIEQVVATDEAAAKAVYEAAKQSGNLQKAAGKNTYVKAQTHAEKDMALELSAAAFKAEAGEILPPVESPLGWHVMRVAKITPASVKSFESVRDGLEKEIAADSAAEKLYEQANKIDDLLAGGAPLDEVAQQFGLKPVSFAKISAEGKDAAGNKVQSSSLPVFDKVLEAAFRTARGQTSQLIETPSGDFLVVGVRDIFPPQEQPLEKVRAAVLASWSEKETAETIDTQAAKINERLKMGETFEKIAASYNKTPRATGLLTRESDAAKAGLGRGALPALFALDKTGAATAVATGDTVTVLRLSTRKTEAPKGQSREETAALEAQIARSLQNDILDQYRTALFAEYGVKIYDDVLQDMFKPREGEETGAE